MCRVMFATKCYVSLSMLLVVIFIIYICHFYYVCLYDIYYICVVFCSALAKALHEDIYKPMKNLAETQYKTRKPVSVGQTVKKINNDNVHMCTENFKYLVGQEMNTNIC